MRRFTFTKGDASSVSMRQREKPTDKQQWSGSVRRTGLDDTRRSQELKRRLWAEADACQPRLVLFLHSDYTRAQARSSTLPEQNWRRNLTKHHHLKRFILYIYIYM